MDGLGDDRKPALSRVGEVELSIAVLEAPLPEVADDLAFRRFVSSNYDIHNKCNLTCEGCYYFLSDQKTSNPRPSAKTYAQFFAEERARGVDFPVFSGGEPSLNPAALREAAAVWQQGIVYTNGVRQLDRALPFRIGISIWGARERNDVLRGARSYDQALASATGDPRAMVLFTISRDNIEDIPAVVEDCAARDIPIAIQDFSVTSTYADMLRNGAAEPSAYFRMSDADDNLSLRFSDRLRIADLLDEMIDRHPRHLILSKALNHWMHRSEAIHDIDPVTGLARDCAILNAPWHRAYSYDLAQTGKKACCAPEFDCSDCRVSIVAMFSRLMQLARTMRRSPGDRTDFLELRQVMMRYFFWDWDRKWMALQR